MFIYYNANPNKESVGDCVVRAMSLALNENYYGVIDSLIRTSQYFNCDMLVKNCYGNMLDELGFKKINGKNRTVKEVAEEYFNKKLLIRIEGHLTTSLYGDIIDTWNTSNEIVDCFWVIE